MPEDIKKLSEEISEVGAKISDMLLAWCQLRGHNPNLIFNVVGQELAYFQKNADFSEYKPTFGAVLRQMDNETLAQQIYDLSDAVKTSGLTERETVRSVFNVLESNFDEESKL
jgi:hypothetical protein